MSWWQGFASRIECEAPLGRQTWFRLGGPARYTFHPDSPEDLASLTHRARQEDVPVKVLGGGANVLVRDDGFDGVVVRLDDDGFRRVDRQGNSVTAGAGVDLMKLARHLSEQGLSGMECMAGIPASVGGAVRMNAGGGHGEIGDVVSEVSVLEGDGSVATWSHRRIGFGYRRTNLDDRVVLSATLELTPDDPVETRRRYEENFALKTRTQPLADKSAGCIFKNPRGASAGAMIDRAGLKGTTCGGARVSNRHANFIVADGAATASDVLRLIDLVRERVRSAFGTELETEIDIW